MSTILLTGGTGFIGSHTAVELLEKGHDVVLVDNLYNSEASVVDRIEKITGKRPVFHPVDACDKAARSKKNPTVIIMNTIKGKGVSFMENNVDFHGRSCKPDEYAKAVEELKAVIQ